MDEIDETGVVARDTEKIIEIAVGRLGWVNSKRLNG